MCSDDIKTLDITQFIWYNLFRNTRRNFKGKMVQYDTENT